MAESDDKIAELQTRLENLVKTQIGFQQEITQIRYELNLLRELRQRSELPPATGKTPIKEYIPPPRIHPPPQSQPPPDRIEPERNRQTEPPRPKPHLVEPLNSPRPAEAPRPAEKSGIEKFIGQNLISKIGILILVIGIAIGAKYAIDTNSITPPMRIVLGYLFGFGLLGLAAKLKAKYHDFSAVLLSGAIAILYFITYFAHSLYGFLSQSTAFGMMTVLTVFAVAAAINYNRQIIAHFGLVGAYAVPFLLSSNSGNYAFLFAYMAIINSGVLAVSLKKYWKPLFYTSFFFTWVIFYGWYLIGFRPDAHFGLAFLFLGLFFLIFYLTFIGYKLISDENLALENVTLISSNAFIFYGIGYSLLDHRAGFDNQLGLFTVANAAIHFAFAAAISRLKRFPNDLVYLPTALTITFATIAIPVQLDGNHVTLVWTIEAAVLFWIGRTKIIALFQYFSFPLMALAGLSLLHDWWEIFGTRSLDLAAGGPSPLFNGNFWTALVFAAAFGFIFYINKDERFEAVPDETLRRPLGYLAAAAALGVLYNCLRIEIVNFFHYLTVQTAVQQAAGPFGEIVRIKNYDFEMFSLVWQINYTMLFLTVLSLINIKKIKSSGLAYLNLLLNAFALFMFVTVGLYLLSELRDAFLRVDEPQYFAHGPFHVLIRYVSYLFAAGLLVADYLYTRQKFLVEKIPPAVLTPVFDSGLALALLIIASSELLNLMDIFGYQESYKLGLSILWGVFALTLIVVGIYRQKRHLRLGAIALFALTLAKLFFYDIADLNTISKTIVFVSLGILMLIVSFLYNKYKAIIFEANES